MKNRYLFLIIIIINCLIAVSCGGDDSPSIYEPPGSNEPGKPADPTLPSMSEATNPFVSGADGYTCYRIPTMVITKNGTILAFSEGRRNSCEDQGDIDIVLKRSTDQGKTWSKLITVKDDGENRCRNQVPIYLPETNRVVLVSCWNIGATGTAYVFVTYSDDEGLTWAPEVDITSSVKPAGFGWYATGPCHGIVKEREPNKGRIVVSSNHNIAATQEGYSHIIYSDDQGKTWKIGGIVNMSNTNESTVTELGNGNLLLNMRGADSNRPSDQRFRITSISSDGGLTWSECVYDNNLIEPMCQGSLLTYGVGKDGKGQILFSNPAHQTSRRNNVLKLSLDDGKSWIREISYTGAENYGGYSDIAKYPDGKIGVLYEYGFKNSGGIWFRNIEFTELK